MILVTDIFFPTKYSQWRMVELKSFIEDMHADILVFKLDAFSSMIFGDDYRDTEEYYHLSDYNILIFDPKYNHLNKYNSRLDGTLFNNKFPASYLFTRDTDVNFSKYDNIYHIFLMTYNSFKKFNIPDKKQIINLYPGGGNSNETSLLSISPDCNIISTQRFITDRLKKLGFKNYIEIIGSPLLLKNQHPTKKQINKNILHVCFSCVGLVGKGSDKYKELAVSYHRKYPLDNICFDSVGACIGDMITNHGFMSMKDLSLFYRNNIDIICNFSDNKNGGFPLGVEAALEGAVLITTDINNASKYYSFSNELLIVDDAESAVEHIKLLYENREKLNTLSYALQQKLFVDFSYDNQMKQRYNFIKSNGK